MVVDSKLPRDYRIHCRLFTDEKLDEQYRRHSAGAAGGCPTSEACLDELRRELARRDAGKRRLTYEELRERRLKRRANKS